VPDKPSKNEEEYFARRDAELLRQQRDAAQRGATPSCCASSATRRSGPRSRLRAAPTT